MMLRFSAPQVQRKHLSETARKGKKGKERETAQRQG